MLSVLKYENSCNTYILFDENRDALIVDPGTNYLNNLINKISRYGLNIKYILITHGHFDHIGGVKDICETFKDAVTFISKEDEICLTNNRYNLSNLFESEPFEPYEPKNLVIVSDNDEFELLGHKVKVIATPFHTSGSVCYYFSDLDYLFSGDTLFYGSVGRTDLVGAEPRKMGESLKKLFKLNLETKIFPGHDRDTTLEREMKYNRYILDIM